MIDPIDPTDPWTAVAIAATKVQEQEVIVEDRTKPPADDPGIPGVVCPLAGCGRIVSVDDHWAVKPHVARPADRNLCPATFQRICRECRGLVALVDGRAMQHPEPRVCTACAPKPPTSAKT